MRWLLRMLIFWVIAAPLFYIFGLPLLLEKVSAKARSDAYAQCGEHINKPEMAQMATLLSLEEREAYCHCVSDGLQLTKDDLPDLLQRKPPSKLTTEAKTLSEKCNRDLQKKLDAKISATSGNVPIQDDFGLSQ